MSTATTMRSMSDLKPHHLEMIEHDPRYLKILIPCHFQGELKSKTHGCGGGCKVWNCSVHGICASQPRNGIILCPCDDYQLPMDNPK